MEIFLVIIGFLLVFLGLLGCVLPIIPGPLLSYLALIILSFAKDWEPFSTAFLVWMAIFTVVVSLIDYLVPILGAKRYGASRPGIWGSVIGILLGTIMFPPFGMFIGAFAGALAGEFITGRRREEAFRASWGVFLGTIAGIGLKLTASGIMTYYFIQAAFR